MKVSVEQAGPCRKLLKIGVDAGALAGDYGEVVRAYTAEARLPGFRKGKTPAAIVENRFAREIDESVRDRAIPRLYREALTREGLAPVAVVSVSNVRLDRRTGMDFDLLIDVAPEFDLPVYRGLDLKRREVSVTDEQVQQRFDALMNGLSRFEDVEGRAVQADDLVRIDYRGTCDGKPMAEFGPAAAGIGAGADFWAVAGEPEFLPGIGKALVGMAAGETRAIDIAFPGDYQAAALAGRTARYEVTVRAIRTRVIPPLDGALLARLGVESEAALRQRLRRDIEAAVEAQAQADLREQAARILLSRCEVDLPQSVIEQETGLAARNIVRHIAAQGATREQILENRDAIVGEAERSSRDRVRLHYILSRIADEEKVAVSDAEVDERIAAMAARYRMQPPALRAEFEKRNGIEGLRSEVRADKTLGLIVAQAKVS